MDNEGSDLLSINSFLCLFDGTILDVGETASVAGDGQLNSTKELMLFGFVGFPADHAPVRTFDTTTNFMFTFSDHESSASDCDLFLKKLRAAVAFDR